MSFCAAFQARLDELAAETERLPEMRATLEEKRALLASTSRDDPATVDAHFDLVRDVDALSARVARLESGAAMSDLLLDSFSFVEAAARDDRATIAAVDGGGGGDPRRRPGPGGPGKGIERFVGVSHRSAAGTIAAAYSAQSASRAPPPDADDLLAGPEPRVEEYACDGCGASMQVNGREALLVCVDCGLCHSHLDLAAQNMTFADRQGADLLTQFCYRREHHFGEWLASVQGREGGDVPEELLAGVRAELSKSRVMRSGITVKGVRAAMKRCGFSKYFDAAPGVCFQLGGPRPILIGGETEATFKRMFSEIQEPFRKHCPSTRRNFLSYSYVLNRFSQLLDRDDLLASFPLLKSAEKLHASDCIWKNICAELGWEFHASV